MSTIIFLVIVVAEAVIWTLMYIVMKNKAIHDHKTKYLQLSELGSKFNLTFSSHEIIAKSIIGLDGVKRKLVILEINNKTNQIKLIPLVEVSSVSVKRSYSSIKPGELRKRKVNEFLETIFLQFDLNDETESIFLPFYDNKINNIADLPGLESKVRNWQIILSKLIGKQNNKLMQEKTQISQIG